MLKIFLLISSLAVFPFFSDSFWGAKYFLAILLLPLLFFKKERKRIVPRFSAPYFSFAELGFLIVAASILLEGFNLFQFFRLFAPFCLYIYISRGREEDFIKTAVRLTGIVSLLGLVQHITKYNPFNAPIPYVTFGNPMYLGAWLAAMLPFSADMLFQSGLESPPYQSGLESPSYNSGVRGDRRDAVQGKSISFYGNLFAFAAGLLVLLLTRSQSAYLGFAVAMIYLFFRRMSRKKAALILISGAALSAILYFSFAEKGDIAFSDSFAARLNYYRTSLEMIKDRPLTGIGSGNYRGNYAPYRLKAGLPYHQSPQWAHCDILHFIAELGLFRALLLIVFLMSVLLKKIPSSAVPYKAGITALLFTSLTGFPFQRPSTLYLFFIFAGLIMREDKTSDERQKSVHKLFLPLMAAAAFVYAIFFAYAQIHSKRGEILMEKGRAAEAAAAFEKAAPIMSRDYRIWLNLGRAGYRSGDIGGALEAYRRCLSLYFDWDICYNLSIAFKTGGNDFMAERFMKDFESLKAE